jgi:hypothetical protein
MNWSRRLDFLHRGDAAPPRLALHERQRAQILAVEPQQIEGDEAHGLPARSISMKIGRPVSSAQMISPSRMASLTRRAGAGGERTMSRRIIMLRASHAVNSAAVSGLALSCAPDRFR